MLPNTSGRRWYVMQVESGAEEKARLALLRHNCDVYYPKAVYWRRLRKGEQAARGVGRVKCTGPLFCGYVFIHVNLGWVPAARLRHSRHAFGLIQSEGVSLPIPDALIAAMQQAEASGDNDKTFEAVVNITDFLGKEYMLMNGPFQGFKASVQSVQGTLLTLGFEGFAAKVVLPLAKMQDMEQVSDAR